jgi:hypothetical protein
MEELNQPGQPVTPANQGKRPTLLTVICILTFIGSGMNLFSSLVIAGFYDLFVEMATEFAEKFNLPGMEMITSATPSFFLFSALFYAGSLAGAILMMNLRKVGFHVYTIAQILLIIAPMYFMGMKSPGIPDMVFSGLFILLYAMNLKVMK